jgi:hypothetical protein
VSPRRWFGEPPEAAWGQAAPPLQRLDRDVLELHRVAVAGETDVALSIV